MAKVKQIRTQRELQDLARELGVRPDWHAPDEQQLTAEARGANFDNAGFYGFHAEAAILERAVEDGTPYIDTVEMYIVLKKDGTPVACVNLATLFAFACGTYRGTYQG